jgi:hypothetical protein
MNKIMKKIKYFTNHSLFFNSTRYLLTPFFFKRRKLNKLFDDSQYFRLNLGSKKKTCYGYVNIDEYRAGKRVYVSSFFRLPVKEKSVKKILLDYNSICRKKMRTVQRILEEFRRVMIYGGVVSVDNILNSDSDLSRMFELAGFNKISSIDTNSIFSVKNYMLSIPHSNIVSKKEIKCKLNSKKALITAFGEDGNISFLELIEKYKGLLDEVELCNVIEYLPVSQLCYILSSAIGLLQQEGILIIKARNENGSRPNKDINIFDKANLVQLVTERGFSVIRLDEKAGYLVLRVGKNITGNAIHSNQRRLENKKICLIGQYMFLRYEQLGFTWSGIPRAVKELGMDYLMIEATRNQPRSQIENTILNYKPDYVLIILKESLPLLFNIAKKLKQGGTKIIFWFLDPEQPKPQDLSEVIDTMFLSNRGQLDEYKNAYNLKRVYYMPQGADPAFMFYNEKEPEIYDIGFSGALSKEPLHERRRELIGLLGEKYKVKITNRTRNNIARFYSQSKMIFGISDFDHELYTSNRFFNALGCGAVYITGKFKGIELLAENKKHILWFKNQQELMDLAQFYTKNKKARHDIRINAQRLAYSKHTWKHRLENIFDITDNKTNEFYGFL